MLYVLTVVHIQLYVINITYHSRYLTYLDNLMCFTIPSRCRIHRLSLGLVYINSRPCHIIWFYRRSYKGIRIKLNVSPSLFAYLDNLMCVTIPSRFRIHRMSLGLVYINSRPCHIIWFYRWSYTGIRIQLNVSPSLFGDLDNSVCIIIPSWCRKHRTSPRLVYIYTGPCHAICSFCSSHTGISIQFTVSPSLFHISRQFDVRYNPLIVPYTPHFTRFSPHNHWTLSCYMILLLVIYMYK
jgi:hypothetical protein